jgi:hypothetical protein
MIAINLNYKISLNFLVVAALLVFANFSYAGPRVGNGGGIWMCMSASTLNPEWMQLTDLFESRNVEKYILDNQKAQSFVADFEIRREFITQFVPELDQLIMKFAPSSYADLEKVMEFTSTQSELTVVNDGQYQVHPSATTCPNGFVYFEQLADYTEDGRILINSTLWMSSALSDLDRSALLLHEIVYKALRGSGDENSVRARRIVGILFAQMPQEKRAELIAQILASKAPAGAEAKIEIYHNRVACQGRVGNKAALLTRSKNRLSLAIGTIHFDVSTDVGAGKPVAMQIEDKDTSSIASFDSKLLSETFLLSRKVSLSLSSHSQKHSASLTCWEESYQ